MTGYERILTTLQGGVADRTPMMLHNFMSAASEKGYSMGEFRNSPKRIARSFIDYARKYDLDGIVIDIDTCIESCAIGVPTDFPDDAPARNHGSIAGGIDACIDAMEPETVLQDSRANIIAEATHLIKQEVNQELFVRGNADQGPFSLSMLAFGMTEFMMALLDDSMKEKIHILLQRALDVHLAYHKFLDQAGADMTSLGDSPCGPDLISVDMYREFALPYHKKLASTLNEAKILNLCHICGNQDLIINDLANVGFTAIEADYKTNIVRAEEAVKGKSVFFGPIDPSGVFFFGTPEQIQKETQRVLEIFKGKNLVIGAGCALPSGVPESHIRAFTDTVKSYTIG